MKTIAVVVVTILAAVPLTLGAVKLITRSPAGRKALLNAIA